MYLYMLDDGEVDGDVVCSLMSDDGDLCMLLMMVMICILLCACL